VIPRYTRPEMAAIWSDEHRFAVMLEIELLACEAMASLGQVPADAAAACRDRARVPAVSRVLEIEATVKHDVIAFLTAVGEIVGPEARFLHKGMTSSDVLDTATAVQYRDAGRLLVQELDGALAALKARAIEHRDTICIGRSHGIHAEPTTFGWKLAGFYDELTRGRQRLLAAIEDMSVGMLSGAVGTYAFIDPRVEEYVCERLGLTPVPVCTQVIPRDRHAAFFTAMALIASSLERAAVEIRHLQRTEVREVEERFTKGQKGSSAMPHKRNPILTENLTGLCRLVRGYCIPAMEDVALWHERDISHSSVERMIGPDATVTLHFALHRFRGVIEGLVVYPENMRKNLDLLGGVHFSQRLMLALVEAGMTREDAYLVIQRNAMEVWAGAGDLRDLVGADADVTSRLDPQQIESVFDEAAFVRNVGVVFSRVFGD
jgi:adenylosuccinate lyase